MKYNLTRKQRLLDLPILWFFWRFYVGDNRKSWHEVKKGIEKHEHSYTIPFKQGGYNFLKCDHEGCTMCNPID